MKLNCKPLGHDELFANERCQFWGSFRDRNYNCVCGCETMAISFLLHGVFVGPVSSTLSSNLSFTTIVQF